MTKWAWIAFLALVLSGCSNTSGQSTGNKTKNKIEPNSEEAKAEHQTESPVPLVVDEQESAAEPAEALSPQEVDNLWDRIAMQFSLDIETNDRIAAQRDWYLKHPAFLQQVSRRAQPFLYYIVEELEKRDMPMEIALLPVVESSFDPFAYSHSRAAGMWQFVPVTAERFKLHNNWWYDARRDVYASTTAALDYLEYLHRYFDGSWEHALAAYNAGEGRVRRAIQANAIAGKPTDYWSLNLPRETQNYVPKLLALAEILSNIDDYAMRPPVLRNEPVIKQIFIGSQLDLAMAAKMMNIDMASLQRLNPGLSRWATSPEGPHRLVVPYHKANQLSQELASLPREKRLNWIQYQVQQGDTLSLIARKHNTQASVLRDINQLQGNMIRTGQPLMIPLSSPGVNSDKGRAIIPDKIDYVVRSGDSLWKIAQKHDVTVKSLVNWNNLEPKDPLLVGQRLVIWPGSDTAMTRRVTYTVQSGDSISRIAQRFQVSSSDVMRWNDLDPQRYLQPGQTLELFVNATKA